MSRIEELKINNAINPITGMPKWAHDCLVTDCDSVEEFADKYRKSDRYKLRGAEYAKAIMDSHYDDIAKRGWTAISQHDNTTGMYITFKPKQLNCVDGR